MTHTSAPAAVRPKAPRNRLTRKGVIFLVVLAGVIAAVIALLVSVYSASGGSYKATVTGYTVINPADLAVSVRVTNTGSSASTPTCTINAQDPSDAYSGIDEVTLQGSLAPGATTNFADNLVITNHGASYVTQVTVSC